MLRNFRYELILWLNHFLKLMPGHMGVHLRNALLPYKKGKDVKIWDNVQIDFPSRLTIGDNTSINRGGILNCGGGITIGQNVLIGPNVTIYSQNHRFKSRSKPINHQGYDYRHTIIEDDVWIASNVIILPGVQIGTGAVIGAGSVVTKNIPPYTICVGAPARPIGMRNE